MFVDTRSANGPLKDTQQLTKIRKVIYKRQGPEHIPCHPHQGLAAQLRVSFASAAALNKCKISQGFAEPRGEGSG